MAGYNEITLPGWQQLVRRLFGLQGSGGNVPVLASEIQPVAIVQEFAPEYLILRGWHPWTAVVAHEFGGAGQIGATELRNPAGSNVLAVVQHVHFQLLARDVAATRANDQMLISYRDPSLAAYTQHDPAVCTRDARRGQASGYLPPLETRWQGGVGASSGSVMAGRGYCIETTDDRPLIFDMYLDAPVVLLPGAALACLASSPASYTVKTIRYSMWGYWHTFESEEVGA